MSSPATLEVITDPAAFDGLVDDWNDLLGRAAEPNVYLTPAWAMAWWRTFANGPRLQAGRSSLHVVAVTRLPRNRDATS